MLVNKRDYELQNKSLLSNIDAQSATSRERMMRIRETTVPEDALAIWFFGQNGFILKSSDGTVIAIDLYLTDSCNGKYPDLPFDLSRRIPILLEPEDLDVDFFLFTHSHEDHLDEETVRRLQCSPIFVAPWEAMKRLESIGIAKERCRLLHPNETILLNNVSVEGTFALPTDNTDLNHLGVLLEFPNHIRFYNTGDTAYAEALGGLLPQKVDVCAICINGGFHNLSHADAARLVRIIAPRAVIPTHYDMMPCNLGDPEMFRIALLHEKCNIHFQLMNYDRPYLYQKVER